MRRSFLFFFLLAALSGSSQPVPVLSDSARISLLTVEPGDEVYSTFGHSALRVYDAANRLDRCYNYGTFEFDQPNFLLKFCRGKLLYYLDIEPYRGFEYGNLADRRGMQEQLLQLNRSQKQRLFELLSVNAREDQRYYKYDFFYDNCATRIRDIVSEALFHEFSYDSTQLALGTTMRQLLRPYLKPHPWMHFGIDLLLGLPADRRARPADFMYLPNGLHDVFGHTKLADGRPLVRAELNIPPQLFHRDDFQPGLFQRPLWMMCFVAIIGLLSMANPRTEHIFDTIFWFSLGVLGLVIALLWFATDHIPTKNNLNILWALPTHLLFFWRRSRSEFTQNYFTGVAILAILVLLFWKWLPQEIPVAALPLVVLVVVKGLWRHYWKVNSWRDEFTGALGRRQAGNKEVN